eukprot:gnl/Hemi2/17056_TR5677_c0_g1_i1.p1 gnl/Hemi2/17056_TR5677_c0_g1~~gnl/Hemi2/17056_TR5677_c0_g1_i1.p1  ORF type:complete len:703 (+),score=308.17 gnl/Hemi2/17056_TR5677_c0_g1_i1:101-2209(+)
MAETASTSSKPKPTKIKKLQYPVEEPKAQIEIDRARMEWTMSNKKREAIVSSPQRPRGSSPERNPVPAYGSRSDLTVNPLSADLAKGTICVKKKKITGVTKLAAAGNQVWCATEAGLRVLSQNARDLKHFDDHHYQAVLGVQNRVFAATREGTICVFDTQTLDCILRLEGHEKGVNALAHSPDGVLSAGADGSIRLWDLETGEQRRVLQCPADVGEINCLTYHHGEVWAGAENGSICVFEAADSEPSVVLKAHEGGVYSLCSHGNQVWSGSDDRHIGVWDAEAKAEVKKLFKHNGRISVLTPVGGKIWSGSFDSKVGVWQPKKIELIGVLPGVYTQIYDIAVVGLFVWIATRDEMVRIFISQGLVEAAQEDLNKYSLSSVSELEALFATTMAENEQLCLLLRSLKTQLMRCEAWSTKIGAADFVDARSEKRDLDLSDLIERLRELESRWDKQRQLMLGPWDLPAQVRELQDSLRENDRVKVELAELRGLFAEVEKHLFTEKERMQNELDLQKSGLETNAVELTELEKRHAREKVESEQRIQALNAELAALQKKVDAITKQLETNQAELNKIRAEKAALDESIKSIENKTKVIGDEQKKLVEAKLKLERDMEARLNEKKQYEEQLAVAQSQLKTQTAQIEQLKADLEKKQKDVAEVEKEEQQQKRALDDVRKQKDELQKQVALEKEKIKQLQKELDKKCCIIM